MEACTWPARPSTRGFVPPDCLLRLARQCRSGAADMRCLGMLRPPAFSPCLHPGVSLVALCAAAVCAPCARDRRRTCSVCSMPCLWRRFRWFLGGASAAGPASPLTMVPPGATTSTAVCIPSGAHASLPTALPPSEFASAPFASAASADTLLPTTRPARTARPWRPDATGRLPPHDVGVGAPTGCRMSCCHPPTTSVLARCA